MNIRAYGIFDLMKDKSLCFADYLNRHGYSTSQGKMFTAIQVSRLIDRFSVYLSIIPQMFNLSGNHLKLLMAIWKLSVFNPEDSIDGNIFFNNKIAKEEIRDMELPLKDSYIDKLISQLAKQGFLFKQTKSRYILNKDYFFKGKITDRTKLQLSVETDPITKKSNCFLLISNPED